MKCWFISLSNPFGSSCGQGRQKLDITRLHLTVVCKSRRALQAFPSGDKQPRANGAGFAILIQAEVLRGADRRNAGPLPSRHVHICGINFAFADDKGIRAGSWSFSSQLPDTSSADWFDMSERAPSSFTHRFQGSTFEDMVGALTQGFGSFDAWCTGRDQPLDWKVDFWSDGKLSLVSNEDCGGWAVRTAPETPESLSIVLPRAGALNMVRGRAAVEGTPGQLLLINNHEPECISVRAGFHCSDSISLDWAFVTRAISDELEMPLIGRMDLTPILDLSTATGQLLGSLAQTIIIGMHNHGPLFHSPIAMSNLTQALTNLVVRLVPHQFSHLLNKKVYLIAPYHVRRAIEFMHANIEQPLLIRSIADAAGVSLRALEMGFRDFKGTTPFAYLRKIRLQAVRNDLLDPSNQEQLRDISLKWGFFHFGRFSAVYRAEYGENPSDTRKRCRMGKPS
jgi:AraC-like DNA-binding protein